MTSENRFLAAIEALTDPDNMFVKDEGESLRRLDIAKAGGKVLEEHYGTILDALDMAAIELEEARSSGGTLVDVSVDEFLELGKDDGHKEGT